MIFRRLCTGTTAFLTAAALAGCGATIDDRAGSAAAGYPVTVTNCGMQQTFTAAPRRVVVNDTNMIEMMFALGLGDRMAGYVVNDGKDRIVASSPWQRDFSASTMLGTQLNKELVQGADADLVFAGWNYGFSEAEGLTPESLASAGIPSYLLTESCRQGDTNARGIMDPIDALYTDLGNLGTIFGVSDRAQKLIAGYRDTIAAARATIPADRPTPKVFLYDGGTATPLTVGTNAAAHAVLTQAGGKNIFDDLDDSWVNTTFEAAADRDPDVIVINDYGHTTAQAKEKFLRDHPLMSNTAAVRNGRFYVMTYPQLTEGPQNPQAIADFAEYLNSVAGR